MRERSRRKHQRKTRRRSRRNNRYTRSTSFLLKSCNCFYLPQLVVCIDRSEFCRSDHVTPFWTDRIKFLVSFSFEWFSCLSLVWWLIVAITQVLMSCIISRSILVLFKHFWTWRTSRPTSFEYLDFLLTLCPGDLEAWNSLYSSPRSGELEYFAPHFGDSEF